MELETSTLQEALERVAAGMGTEARMVLESGEGDTLRIGADDGVSRRSTEIACEGEAQGRWTTQLATLRRTLKSVGTERTRIAIREEEGASLQAIVEVEAGRFRMRLHGARAEDPAAGAQGTPGRIALPQGVLKSLLAGCARAAGRAEGGRDAMLDAIALQWDGNTVRCTATDRSVMGRTTWPLPKANGAAERTTWLLPSAAARTLAGCLGEDDDEVALERGTDGWLRLRAGTEAWEGQALGGPCPDGDKVLAPVRDVDEGWTFEATAWSMAVRGVQAAGGHVVDVRPGEQEWTLHGRTEAGEPEVNAVVAVDVEEVHGGVEGFTIDPKRLEKATQSMGADRIRARMAGAQKPIHLEGADGDESGDGVRTEWVVMPMR